MSPGVSSKPEDSDPVYTLNCEEPTKVPATNVRMTEDKFRTKRVETVNAWNKAHTLKVTYASTTTLFTAHELEPFFIGSDNPPIDR